MLSSTEQLSTEEESSDSGGEGGSDDELARNLETLLGGRKTTRQLTHEQEELERQELRKLLDKPVSGHSSSRRLPVMSSSLQCKVEESGEASGRGKNRYTPPSACNVHEEPPSATPLDGDDTSSLKSFSSAMGVSHTPNISRGSITLLSIQLSFRQAAGW